MSRRKQPQRPLQRYLKALAWGPPPPSPVSLRVVPSLDPQLIRNFCVIAHIDHGKSTLADRMLQMTGVVDQRIMRDQYLYRMEI